ncbi:B-cell receptor CD22 isoform X2 [Megalobrama amblycephala]|uniref:B-cell receptor CD22 isoform X2 n=1 Tax=Megalobrama amblycephala TaxID=75352 RepID=UPI0020147238|nr:B-cell receptor CD22 isoform X2 [Megalobrama amblycephala]
MSVAEKVCVFVFLLQGVCCKDFSISLPERIEALSGSCVIIKCTFEIGKDEDKYLTESDATGLWLKDGDNANNHQVFNSRDPKPDHFKGEITGKLHEKNCTTIFYDVSSNHNESPPKRTVKLYVEQKEVQDQEEVLEGSSVSLRCSAETLCSSPPPTLTWSSTPRIPLSESSRQQELISDLNFTAAHRHHRVTFTCTITYQILDKNKTAQDSITLHVQYSPKNTSVSVLPSGSVLEGSSVTLTCSSDANPAVLNYTWSRDSEGQLKQLQTGDTLTFNKINQTQGGWYNCTAQNKHGTQESSVMLDIQYAPKISPSSSCNGTDVTECFCEVDGNPSPKLEWRLSGRPVTNSSDTFISEERLSSTVLRSSITLHQSLTHTSLQCVSRNTHGTAEQLFYLVFTQKIIQKTSWFDVYSLLVGVVGGATFITILWITTLLYKRICRTQRGDKTGLIGTDVADSVDNGEEPFYVNKGMMSPDEAPTLNHPETLQYSTINFMNTKPESKDIRGISSLTTDYAVVGYFGRNVADSEAKIREVTSMTHEDAIYQVPHKVAIKAK